MATCQLELEHAIGCAVGVRDSLHLHPNGSDFVCATGGAVMVTNLTDAHQQALMAGHDDYITCTAVSHDGTMVASGQQGKNADVILWDGDQHVPKFRWQEHDFGIACLAFTNDDRYLVTVGNAIDKRMFFWDCATGLIAAWAQVVPDPTSSICEAGRVRDIKRRDQSQYQFVALGGHEVHVWAVDMQMGESNSTKVEFGSKHSRDYICLCMAPDYELLYCGTTTGDVVCVLMKNFVVQRMFDVCGGGVQCMVHLRQVAEPTLVCGGGDGTVTILCSPNGRDFSALQQIRLDGMITSLSPSMDDAEVMAATSAGGVYRVRTRDLTFALHAQFPTRPVHRVTFPHGISDQFVSAGSDGVATVWDANDYSARLMCWTRGVSPVTAVTATPDILITAYDDGKLRSYDMMQGSLLWDINDAHRGGANCVQVAENARFFMTGGAEGELRVWELRTRELVSHLKEHQAAVNDCHLFGNDRYGISCSRDHALLTWDLQAEKRLTAHREKQAGINQLALFEDQTTVVTAGAEKILTMWDLRTRDPVHRVPTATEIVGVAMSSASGTPVLATGGHDHKVKLWDARKLQLWQEEAGHSKPIESLAFSPDGKQLVSCGIDHSVMVWNVFPTG